MLVVDDNPVDLRALRRAIADAGYDVEEAEDGEAAMVRFAATAIDVVVTDLEMPRLDGLGVLAAVRAKAPHVPVVVVTARSTVADCARAMRAGAADFLTKPFHPTELVAAIAAAVGERSSSPEPVVAPRGAHLLIGDSAALRDALEVVERVAHTDATVLIRGETGTGKELVARLLHGLSARAPFPMVAVNCGAITESVVESELFGHVRGAFTGASERRPGKFLQANRGTIFLDEIGDLSLTAQVKLLRVLQEREIMPVGSDRPVSVDVRVVAATHRDLGAMVADGKFRADLYYRLDVVVVGLPALRERPSDVPLLIDHFIQKHGARYRRSIRLTAGAVAQLATRSWPGNVRELENVIERLVLTSPRAEVREEDLPADSPTGPVRASTPAEPPAASVGSDGAEARPAAAPFTEAIASFELKLLEDALQQTGGNKKKAAALLGINRTTLIEKLKRRRRESDRT